MNVQTIREKILFTLRLGFRIWGFVKLIKPIETKKPNLPILIIAQRNLVLRKQLCDYMLLKPDFSYTSHFKITQTRLVVPQTYKHLSLLCF